MDIQPSDFIFTEKPRGISTHQNEPSQIGWVEYQQNKTNSQLWVVHRLDKSTSGALLLASNAAAAEKFRQLFEQKKINKTYLFITQSQSTQDFYEVTGEIKKMASSQYAFNPEGISNSHTQFKRLKRSPFFELWQAQPLTGKSHQIRLHAQSIGLPILGDQLYGGSPYPFVCLHAWTLNFLEYHLISHPPLFFERLGLLPDRLLVQFLEQLDQRQRVFNFLQNPTQILRGFSVVDQGQLFVLDILGPQLWLNFYQDTELSLQQKQRFEWISQLLNRPLITQQRLNRGAGHTVEDGRTEAINWTALESDLCFELRSHEGFSHGLFLDQKLNRQKLKTLSSGKTVLNLFCYTSGFTVAALKGGAQQVVSVDISKNYLDWSKKNLELNQLDLARSQWIKWDAREWITKLLKKPPCQQGPLINRFDLIICDPPTFARTPKGVFRLEKEFVNLVQDCIYLLNAGGTLLFSCNLEALDESYIEEKLLQNISGIHITPGQIDLDFLLGAPHGTSKTFWIKKSV